MDGHGHGVSNSGQSQANWGPSISPSTVDASELEQSEDEDSGGQNRAICLLRGYTYPTVMLSACLLSGNQKRFIRRDDEAQQAILINSRQLRRSDRIVQYA